MKTLAVVQKGCHESSPESTTRIRYETKSRRRQGVLHDICQKEAKFGKRSLIDNPIQADPNAKVARGELFVNSNAQYFWFQSLETTAVHKFFEFFLVNQQFQIIISSHFFECLENCLCRVLFPPILVRCQSLGLKIFRRKNLT